MRALLLAAAVTWSLAPLTALAQEHGEHGDPAAAHEGEHAEHAEGEHHAISVGDLFHETTFIGAIFNFTLLVIIFVWFGRKPLMTFLVNRKRDVEESLAEAATLRAAAAAKEKELSDKLAKLDHEMASIKAEMVKAGEAERDRIVEEAEAKAARIRKDAEFVVEQQMKQLRVDVTREAVDAAVAAAQEVLAQGTTSADQQRLAQDYVARLGEIGKSSGRAS
jgi:F-type H+-transporting ATPase subunit b